MDHHVVSDFQIIAERDLHMVECFEVPAALPKNPLGQEPSELHAEMHVFGQRTPVEHLPEPDERLDTFVPLQVDLRVVLGFECHISGVHLC